MKKVIIFVLICMLIVAFTACNNDNDIANDLQEQQILEQSTILEQPDEADADVLVDDEVQQQIYEEIQFNEIVYESEILRITRVSRYVYKHTSYYGRFPCHGMVIVYQNEVVVFDTAIDDKSSSELINWITESLNAEIIAVIPTHFHIDSLGGLNEFHNRGIRSYAYDKTIQLAIENRLPVPKHGFDGFMELEIGDQKVYVAFMGEGHTIDNIIGYWTLENIMFGGCLIRNIGGGTGNTADASLGEWSETVRNIKLRFPNVEKIIVGHGEIGGSELLDYTINLFQQFEQ